MKNERKVFKLLIFIFLFFYIFFANGKIVKAETKAVSIDSAYCVAFSVASEWNKGALPYYFKSSNFDQKLYSSFWTIFFGVKGNSSLGLKVVVENGVVTNFEEVSGSINISDFPQKIRSGEDAVVLLRKISGYETSTIKMIDFIFGPGTNTWYWGLQTEKGVVSVKAGTPLDGILNCFLTEHPQYFWSQVQNSPNIWSLRKTPGTQNKPASDIIKTIPNGWAVKVASTTDENGNNIELDGYRWYKVVDTTDGAIGWLAAKSLVDGIVYLENNQANQTDLEKKAKEQLDIKEKRTPVVLASVDNYFSEDNLSSSLYGGGGGFDGGNNFQKFIQGSSFPKELILAVVAQESGKGHNNEICSSAKDGGIGIMQMTSTGLKGLGSGLKNYSHLNDCRAGMENTSKYYSNTFQGIYANIKDGFRTLQSKYRKKCPQSSIFIKGLEFTCQDIEKVLTVWGYNGYSYRKDENGKYIHNYLRDVSNKLKNLNLYFPGVSYSNNDSLIEKFVVANNNRIEIKLHSPGELQVFDSQGNATGLFNGIIKNEISDSMYDEESEAAVVFFPNDSYIYQVLGTGQGTYGLSIDSANNEATSSFNAIDIPISAGVIHQYIVDWNILAQGGQGVTIQVDENSDGVFDYQFKTGGLLNDKIAPTTTIQLIGDQDQNNLYTSDVKVSFSVQDNQDGVGVFKTEYSLDGGIVWNKYTQPFNISEEGTSTLLYRSFDFLGNQELAKIQVIKINKINQQAMKFFSVEQMEIFWRLDCQDLQKKLNDINVLFNLKEFQVDISKKCLKNKNYFVVFGNFELPAGYRRKDLSKSAFFNLQIAGQKISDKVIFKEVKNTWLYKEGEKNDSLDNGIDIKTEIINWDNKKAVFFIQGELNFQGINVNTALPEVTTSLEIPLSSVQNAGSIFGMETVKFKKFSNFWLYRTSYQWISWLKRWI